MPTWLHEHHQNDLRRSNPTLLENLAPVRHAALAYINGEITRQALFIAYLDDFKLMMIVTFAILPLLFFMKRGNKQRRWRIRLDAHGSEGEAACFRVGKRRLGRNGPEVSAIGLGCMGMSEFYGAAAKQESIATIHHALDRGVTFLDTADMYGVGRNEELVGRAIARPPRRGLPGDQVRQCPRPERRVPRRPRRSRICPLGLRGEPQAAGRRDDRPLLPASRRSQRADRGHGRRDGAAAGGGEGPLPRPVRSGAADDPRRPCDVADHRGADRAVAVEPRCGSRGAADGARARHRLCRLFAARPRLPDRPVQVAGRLPRGRLPQATTRASRARISRRTSSSSSEVEAAGRGEGLHDGAARARLGACAGRRHRADPRHQARAAISTTISALWR